MRQISSTISAADIVSNVSYIKIWDIEKSLDVPANLQWAEENYTIVTVSWVLIIAAYLTATFTGQKAMKDKKPYDLQRLWTFWNFALSIFSLIGFLRTSPELFNDLRQDNGFHQSVCKREYNAATAFWGLLMMVSKVVELGDTVFVVLKKKPLIFLNWGHHATAVFAGVQLALSMSSSARWSMVMNYFVHAQMYFYFGIRTLNFKTPKVLSMMVTSVQMTQMFIGTFVAGYSVYAKLTGIACFVPAWQAFACFFAYMAFSGIFANFFYHSYIKAKPVRPAKKVE